MARYATTFPNTENPISEGGAFTTGDGATDTAQEVSGECRVSANVGNATVRLATPSIGGGQFVQQLIGTNVQGEQGPMSRIQGSADASGYYFSVWDNLTSRLQRLDDTGTLNFTTLGADLSSVPASSWLRLESIGSDHRAIVNGVLWGERSDATYGTGQPGLFIYSDVIANQGIADWSGGDIAVFSPVIIGASAAMAVTASNGGTLTPAFPAGYTAVAGDIEIILAHHSGNGPFTTPSLSQIVSDGTTTIDDNNTAAQRVTAYWRRFAGGETAQTFQLATNTVTTVRGAILLIIRGCVPTGNPFEVVGRNLNAAAATISFPSVTTTLDRDLILALGAYEDDPSARDTPTGWGQPAGAVYTSALGNDMALNYFATYQDVAGATGAASTTVSGGTFANSPSVGAVLAFRSVLAAAMVHPPGPRPPFVRRGPLEVRAV